MTWGSLTNRDSCTARTPRPDRRHAKRASATIGALPRARVAMKLLYFPLLARNTLIEILAKEKGLELEVACPEWPAYKESTLFGQLPQLECESAGKVCQSMAIARVLARRAKCEGESECDFIASEMLLEKFVEVYDELKAVNVYNVGVPTDKVAATTEALVKHFEHMESLVNAERGTVGDLAALAAVCVAREFGVDAILAKAPKVKAYYEAKKSVIDAAVGGYNAWFKPESA